MSNLTLRLHVWYEQLSLRERLLFILLVWAITYAFLSLLIFRPLNNQITTYMNQIREAKNQLNSLELQISAVDKIANSQLYKDWKAGHLHQEKMQTQYKSFINNFSSSSWHTVLRTVIASHPNITLAHIENSPETLFAPETLKDNNTQIYQQSLTLIVYGDYFNTISYLEHIEKVLPTIHWDTLKYEVISYPTAKITMEFSVFYDKPIKG